MEITWPAVAVFIGSLLATLADAVVKMFQTRNIALGHEWAAMWTSWFVSTTWFANVSFVVHGGYSVLISGGIGGSIGVLIAMRLHKHIFSQKEPAHVPSK